MNVIKLQAQAEGKPQCVKCEKPMRWYHTKRDNGYIFFEKQLAQQLKGNYKIKILKHAWVVTHKHCTYHNQKTTVGSILEQMGDLQPNQWY